MTQEEKQREIERIKSLEGVEPQPRNPRHSKEQLWDICSEIEMRPGFTLDAIMREDEDHTMR